MISFDFTENQLEVQRMARELTEKKILPEIQKYDREQKPNPHLLKDMAEADMLGFCLPEKYGGLGMDYISLGLACEELEYGDTSARVILSAHIGLAVAVAIAVDVTRLHIIAGIGNLSYP